MFVVNYAINENQQRINDYFNRTIELLPFAIDSRMKFNQNFYQFTINH